MQILKATLRENSEKCELVASLENNVLLAKYREKCRQFELDARRRNMLDHERRAKRCRIKSDAKQSCNRKQDESSSRENEEREDNRTVRRNV